MTEVIVRTLGNKPAVFERGASVAQTLVELDNCDLVLIVWDLKPPLDSPASCMSEADRLRASISGIPSTIKCKIKLLCLTYELEAWLLADDSAVRKYLSKPTHPCKWRLRGSPDSFDDAKAVLIGVFRDFRGLRYEDFREAIKIASRWTTTAKLRRIHSFGYFVELLTGSPASEFQQDGSVCADLCHSGSMMGRN